MRSEGDQAGFSGKRKFTRTGISATDEGPAIVARPSNHDGAGLRGQVTGTSEGFLLVARHFLHKLPAEKFFQLHTRYLAGRAVA